MSLQIGHQFKNQGILTALSDELIVIERSITECDGDGANGQFGKPPCYAPKGWGETLDDLGDAGRPGNWWALVTSSGNPDGEPVIQIPTDPAPGAYISTTSLLLRNSDGSPMSRLNPFRYVDAATVPFIVVCPEIIHAVGLVVMGCKVILTNTVNGIQCAAVVADQGPSNEAGEISVAALEALSIPGNARGVGTDARLLKIEIFPGTSVMLNGVTYPLQAS